MIASILGNIPVFASNGDILCFRWEKSENRGAADLIKTKLKAEIYRDGQQIDTLEDAATNQMPEGYQSNGLPEPSTLGGPSKILGAKVGDTIKLYDTSTTPLGTRANEWDFQVRKPGTGTLNYPGHAYTSNPFTSRAVMNDDDNLKWVANGEYEFITEGTYNFYLNISNDFGYSSYGNYRTAGIRDGINRWWYFQQVTVEVGPDMQEEIMENPVTIDPEVPVPDYEGDSDTQINLKAQIADIPASAVKGEAITIDTLIELEGAANIISDIALKIDGVEVGRHQDLAIGESREVKFNFEMPDKLVEVYVEVNPDRNKPLQEVRWDDNTSQKFMINMEEPKKNPNPEINVSITASKSIAPKSPYSDWSFTVTVTWKDLYEWKRVKVEDAYTDENGVRHPAEYEWKQFPIYKDYTLKVDAYGQMMKMYYPSTGEQTFESKEKSYPSKSKTVSWSGSESYTFSYPGNWLLVDTKSTYGFGVGGYNAKIVATLNNGAKDTELVFVNGIPPVKAGVELSK